MKNFTKIVSAVVLAGALTSAAFANGYSKGYSKGPVMPVSTVAADYFSGPFIGIEGGINHDNSTYKDTESNGDISKSYGSQMAGFGGLYLGYGQVFAQQGYFGGQIYGRWQPGDQKIASGSGTGGNDSAKTESRYAYGLALKLGYLPTPSTMIYLLGGVENSKFKLTEKENGVSQSKSKYRVGYYPGIGADVALTNNIQVGTSYRYIMYSNFNTTLNGANFKAEPSHGLWDVHVAYRFEGF